MVPLIVILITFTFVDVGFAILNIVYRRQCDRPTLRNCVWSRMAREAFAICVKEFKAIKAMLMELLVFDLVCFPVELGEHTNV